VSSSAVTTPSRRSFIDRWLESLCDPRTRDRAAAQFLLLYGVLWFVYAMISRSTRDLNADMAEMVIWTREMALGYPKHPPLPAGILWVWFSVFPVADWSYTILAAITVSLGIYFAFKLAAEWLEGDKLASVLFLLAVIPFYNFLGLKWDQNSLLIPLWAVAMWALIRSLDTRKAGWAILCGAAAAASMLTKYWSVFLLLAMGITVLADPRIKAYFRSPAPYLVILTTTLLLAPHIWWLVAHDFPPMRWVTQRRTATSLRDWLEGFGGFTFSPLAYAIVALILYYLGTRPSRAGLADSLWPADPLRRRAALLFWLPLLVPIAVAVAMKTKLVSLWNIPALNLLPVVLMSSPKIVLPRFSLKVMAIVALIVPLVSIAISPGVAWIRLKYGGENHASYAQLAGEALATEWHRTTDKPLRLVAGPFGLISTAAAYMKDKPSTFADFDLYLSPWAVQPRIDREGLAIICPSDYYLICMEAMNRYAPNAPRKEVTIVRKWLGQESRPEKFIIAIRLPK
jgi:4-amino-4-deoxy-L-arabinose transferase-like glycosyltransferase